MLSAHLGVLQKPNFLKLWAGQAVSQLGSQVTLLALPLTAILVLGATPFQVGLLTALGSLPTLLFGLIVGVWVDRLRRRPLLILADLGRCLVLLAVPVAALLDRLSMGYLCGVAFLAGALGLVFDVAAASFLPGLVGGEHLVEAGGKLGLSSAIARIAGPGLGGALVQLVGAPFAIAADAASFLVSALSVIAIRDTEDAPKPAARGRQFWPELGDGVRVVARDPVLRPLVGATGWLFFWNSVLEAVWLLYVIRQLGLAPALVGTVFAVGNLGLLLGAASVTRVTERLGVGRGLAVAVAALALADLATPLIGLAGLVATDLSLAVVILFVSQVVFGWSLVVFTTTSGALRQASTPDELRGRMSATTRVLLEGLTPLGAILGGVLGQQLGLQTTLVLTALGEFLAVAGLLAPPIRTLRALPGARAGT